MLHSVAYRNRVESKKEMRHEMKIRNKNRQNITEKLKHKQNRTKTRTSIGCCHAIFFENVQHENDLN